MKNSTIEIYDIINNRTVNEVVNPIDDFQFSNNLSADNSVWIYGRSDNKGTNTRK